MSQCKRSVLVCTKFCFALTCDLDMFSWHLPLKYNLKVNTEPVVVLHLFSQPCPQGNKPYTCKVKLAFIFDSKTRHPQGGITAEGQKKAVSTALDALRNLVALQTDDKGSVGVLTLIDMEEVITGLHVKTAQQMENDLEIVICIRSHWCSKIIDLI